LPRRATGKPAGNIDFMMLCETGQMIHQHSVPAEPYRRRGPVVVVESC
jgi:hypothetical protein